MTTYYEEPSRRFVEEEIQGLLNKYHDDVDDNTLLSDLISFSYLTMYKKKIQ